MDEEELEELIILLAEQFSSIGREDLADENNYLSRDAETGEARIREPRRRLVEMLKAFERSLAVQDRATYVEAFQLLNDALPTDQSPQGAFVVPTPGSRDVAPIDLSHAPELGDLRDRLLVLAARIADVGSMS